MRKAKIIFERAYKLLFVREDPPEFSLKAHKTDRFSKHSAGNC